jgi:hypothetical protein
LEESPGDRASLVSGGANNADELLVDHLMGFRVSTSWSSGYIVMELGESIATEMTGAVLLPHFPHLAPLLEHLHPTREWWVGV